jgi:NAD(P)H-hydrate epimerase
MTIPWADTEVPFISTEQMIEVDRAMMEDFGIDLTRMMENAGRNLAHLARERFLGGDPRGKRVAVLAGTGGNGGGALVAARRLHGYGAEVHVFVTRNELTPVPAAQLEILQEIGVDVSVGSLPGATVDLVIDGLIGYSLSGNPRGIAADLIHWANNADAPVLSLDAPSGLDTTTGTAFDPTVTATATMTLALPKDGLRAAPAVGELYLADISVPAELYARPPLDLDVGRVFHANDIVRLA